MSEMQCCSNVRLSLATGDGPTRIEVDGHDLAPATRGIVLRGALGEITTLELDLVLLQGTTVDGEAEVVIPEPTRAALLALGWTPPG